MKNLIKMCNIKNCGKIRAIKLISLLDIFVKNKSNLFANCFCDNLLYFKIRFLLIIDIIQDVPIQVNNAI